MAKRPQLGQWFTLTGFAQPVKTPVGRLNYWPENRTWKAREFWGKEKTKCAMYIGWRTVFDGVIDLISSDEGCNFTVTQPREVWLFVESDRRNIIRVFPEQVCMEATE